MFKLIFLSLILLVMLMIFLFVIAGRIFESIGNAVTNTVQKMKRNIFGEEKKNG